MSEDLFVPNPKWFKGGDHPADRWWLDSVVASFRGGWLASTVFGNRNSRRFCALVRFRNRWKAGKIAVSLPEMTLFCPSEAEAGHVAVRTLDSIFVYLAPQLEFDSQRDADFAVFHELAHIALGHLLPMDSREHIENEADLKAAEWGCGRRTHGKRIFSKLTQRL